MLTPHRKNYALLIGDLDMPTDIRWLYHRKS